VSFDPLFLSVEDVIVLPDEQLVRFGGAAGIRDLGLLESAVGLPQSLSHSKWDCKYHIVFVPKRRRKVIFGPTRSSSGTDFP
jgi:hypothetical protein